MPIISTFGSLSSRGFGGFGASNSTMRSILGRNSSGTIVNSALDSLGNSVILLNTGTGSNNAGYEYYLASFNASAGSVLFSKVFSGILLTCMALDSSDNVYLGGYTPWAVTPTSPIVIKLDNTGNVIWKNKYNGFRTSIIGIQSITTMVIDSSNNIYISDSYNGMKLNSAGIIIFDKDSVISVITSSGNTYGMLPPANSGYQSVNRTTNVMTNNSINTPYYIIEGTTLWVVNSVQQTYMIDSSNNLYSISNYTANYYSGPTQNARVYWQLDRLTGTALTKSSYSITNLAGTVDTNGNIYLSYPIGTTTVIVCFNSSGTQQWINSITPSSGNGFNVTSLKILGSTIQIAGSYGFLTVPKDGSIDGFGIYYVAGLSYTYSTGGTAVFTTPRPFGFNTPTTTTTVNVANSTASLSFTNSNGTIPVDIAVAT